MRTVVITGASSGFGWAMTEKFLREGWMVHATSRSGVLPGATALPHEQKSRLQTYSLDLLQSTSLHAFCAAIKSLRIDVLINNAGFGLFGALEDLSEDQIRRQMEVNFTGTVLLTQNVLPQLRANRGHIINVSSAFGFSGFPLTSVYCASKFALEGWSEALRFELSPHQVQVTVVQPGAHRTKFATNVEWGSQSFAPTSEYKSQSFGYKNLMQKLTSRPRFQRPESVAARVVRIAGRPRAPFRIRCGKDVQASYWMRRLFPASVFLKLSDSLFRRLLRPHGAV